jgi:4-diphosphocytidyl-2-C-methyl-D-erythritol kinase
VTGKRADGYHIIDSVMQSISLYDTLTLRKFDNIKVVCSKSEFSGEKNIAFTAAKAFFDYTKISGGADIFIEKGIPDAGGLGGGSSDAAGVILGLDKLYNTKLSLDELLKIGLSVGADVPFCVFGGTARVGGIGEELYRLPSIKGLYFIIAKNGTKPSTGEMYRQLDSIENPVLPDTQGFINALLNDGFNKAAGYIGNSFEALTGVFGIDEALADTNYTALCLSGSGPCVFAAYSNECDANKALNILKVQNIEAYIATPAESGIEIM